MGGFGGNGFAVRMGRGGPVACLAGWGLWHGAGLLRNQLPALGVAKETRRGSHMATLGSVLPVPCTLCAMPSCCHLSPTRHVPLLPLAAWNNLGDAYERKKAYGDALAAYQEALTYAPDNKVAQARAEYCRTRLARTA